MEKGKAEIKINFEFINKGCRIERNKTKHVENKTQSIFFDMISDEIDKALKKADEINVDENEIDLDDIDNKKLDELLEDLATELKELRDDIKKKRN